jgi:hypothetical protein
VIIRRRALRSITGVPMKLKTIVAVFLIALGVTAFAYQVMSYATLDRGMDIGSMHMSTRQANVMPLLLLFGAIALIGGIALLLVDKNDFKPTATP